MAKKKRFLRYPVLISLYFLFAIPLAVGAIMMERGSFDFRSSAITDYQCSIDLNFVNTNSVEVGSKLKASINIDTNGDLVQSINIRNATEDFFNRTLDNPASKITADFVYIPKEVGVDTIQGNLSINNDIYSCTPLEINVLQNNTSPIIEAVDSQANQVLKPLESYEFELSATDIEQDKLYYSYTFTPGTDWLKATTLSNGDNGDLKIKFAGTPKEPGSYLANIFVHDGYNRHLKSYAWIISVEDINFNKTIPNLEFTKIDIPESVLVGESVTVDFSSNEAEKFNIYTSTTPSDRSSWELIESNIPGTTKTFQINTSELSDGTYNFVIEAVSSDGGTNIIFTPSVVVGNGVQNPNEGETDDYVLLGVPQVINLSPEQNSQVRNRATTIKATLLPSKDASFENLGLISIKVDDIDVSKSEDLQIAQQSDEAINLIYLTPDELGIGAHKVEINITDSNSRSASTQWTFDVIGADGESSERTVNILGLWNPTMSQFLRILAIAALIFFLVIIAPWLLYLAWRNNDDEDEYYDYTTEDLPAYDINTQDQTSNASVSTSVADTSFDIEPTRVENSLDIDLKAPQVDINAPTVDVKTDFDVPTLDTQVKATNVNPVNEQIELNPPQFTAPAVTGTQAPIVVREGEELDININTHVDNSRTRSYKQDQNFTPDIQLAQETPNVEVTNDYSEFLVPKNTPAANYNPTPLSYKVHGETLDSNESSSPTSTSETHENVNFTNTITTAPSISTSTNTTLEETFTSKFDEIETNSNPRVVTFENKLGTAPLQNPQIPASQNAQQTVITQTTLPSPTPVTTTQDTQTSQGPVLTDDGAIVSQETSQDEEFKSISKLAKELRELEENVIKDDPKNPYNYLNELASSAPKADPKEIKPPVSVGDGIGKELLKQRVNNSTNSIIDKSSDIVDGIAQAATPTPTTPQS